MREPNEMKLMLEGYGLTTAQFYYHMPDHPNLLQTFLWQHYDLAPDYPELFKFIDFWKETLDGPLHSIEFTHKTLVAPNRWRKVDHTLHLH